MLWGESLEASFCCTRRAASSRVLEQRIRQKGGTVLMTTELKQTPLVLVESPMFEKGMHAGASWYFHGDIPCRPVMEKDVIDFLQGNVVELAQEDCLDEDRLRSTAGFLIGWIAAQQLPPTAHAERISS